MGKDITLVRGPESCLHPHSGTRTVFHVPHVPHAINVTCQNPSFFSSRSLPPLFICSLNVCYAMPVPKTHVKLGEFPRVSAINVIIDSLFDDPDWMVLLMVQIGANLFKYVIGDVVRWVAGYDILALGRCSGSRGDRGIRTCKKSRLEWSSRDRAKRHRPHQQLLSFRASGQVTSKKHHFIEGLKDFNEVSGQMESVDGLEARSSVDCPHYQHILVPWLKSAGSSFLSVSFFVLLLDVI